MQYTKKDLGSYNLHLINTDKFKTITTRIVFHTPIIRDEITKRVVLSDILLQSTNKYDSKRSLTIEAEDLYSVDVATNNQRLGNYIFTGINMQCLNDKYTEEGNFEKSLAFLSEIVFNPDIENKAFKKEKLDLAKYNTVVQISSIKEEPTNYSLIRMAEAYDKESPISYRMTGYIDDLNDIDEENLYETYTNMISNDYVDIFVVGNFDNTDMLTLIKKYFKFRKIKKQKETYFLKEKKPRKRRLFAKETVDNTQSKLAIACPITNLTDYEKNYVLPLANMIYGGGTDSKLFKEVREKNSLCYSITSFANKLDNLLVITSGIDKDNYEKTVELTNKLLQEMKKGHFTDNEMSIAKEYFNTYLDELEESESRMINEIFMQEILNQQSLMERIKVMNKVKKQEITKVFKKINMDTVFLLEGVKHEDN